MSETIPVSEEATFGTLREANQARQIEWDVGNQISLAYRGNEFAGEAGEVCNVIKKIERERMGIAGSRDTVEHLAEELADAVICVDLIAMVAGIDLEAAVEAKFNATSEKVGLSTRYRRPHPVASAAPADLEGVRNAVLEEAAQVARGWLSNWSHDLFDTWESYVEAKTTGRLNGRRISAEDADHYAKDFRERAEAVDGCVEGVTDAIRALKGKSPPAPQLEAVPTHRHKKRRTEYVLVGYGKMQAEFWVSMRVDTMEPEHRVDMREVAIYRSVTGPNEWWVRPRENFDAEFEEINHGS